MVSKNIILFLIVVICLIITRSTLFGQTTTGSLAKTGSISGKVIDSKTKEANVNAYVRLFQNNKIVDNTVTDFDGLFHFDSLKAGVYDLVTTYIGYDTMTYKSLSVSSGNVTHVNILCKSHPPIVDFDYIKYKIPLTNHYEPTKVIYTKQQIDYMPY